MSEQELFHLLALLKIDGVGDIVAKKLLLHCGSAENIFKSKSSQLSGIDGVGTSLTNNFKDKSVFAKAEIFIRTMLRWALNIDVNTRKSFLYMLSN